MENKSPSISDEPRKLTYQLIRKITDNLSEERKLGSGSFGTVYKGLYENGTTVAVKVYDVPKFNDSEFQKEFQHLRKLKHPNVVELVGFCNESEEEPWESEGQQVIAHRTHSALCLEYVHNGTLENQLQDESRGLNWHVRYKIIRGVCEGLKYLHDGLKPPVLHLDLKPGNILLDENMVPKIADFGLSKLFGEETTNNTREAAGTCGYWPPEYIVRGQISKEFDIFSLGVIIVKVMAGHKGYELLDGMGTQEFVDHVHDKWRQKLSEKLSPRSLEVYCQQIKTCIEIALECTKWDRRDRPRIHDIVSRLMETETMIGVLGLQIEQFRDGESIPPKKDMQKRAPPELKEREMGVDASKGKKQENKLSLLSTLPRELPFDFWKEITDNFSEERRVGRDALGTVYRGVLQDGQVIAVKKLGENSLLRPHKALNNEVLENILGLKHNHIVKLVGFCNETQKKAVQVNGKYIITDIVESILSYEYLPKGSLHKYIFAESSILMDWGTRFKIVKGICQGLHFLHGHSIIHMDLKPENVLLDDDLVPKIHNFALSRLLGQEQTRVITQNVLGSRGYLAPEYVYRGEISAQADIYCLGLTIFQIVTAEENSPEIRTDEPDEDNMDSLSGRKFINKVRENWRTEHLASKYPSVNDVALQQIKACIEIGLMCVEIDRRNRPSMNDIVHKLCFEP